MKKKRITIFTPLNTMGFSYAREIDEAWLLSRLDIMKKYTARSLEVQTDQNFDWHILVREETKNFIRQNFDCKIDYKVVTQEESDEAIYKIADLYDDLLMIRLNSDDCYQKDFIKTVSEFEYTDEKEALVFQNGYMWYMDEDIIVERHFPSPPFFGYIYKAKEYAEGKRYDVGGHNYVRIKLKTHALKEYLWLWLVHNNCNKILRGSAYPDPKEFNEINKEILKDFGL